jgi:hypothetical protein
MCSSVIRLSGLRSLGIRFIHQFMILSPTQYKQELYSDHRTLRALDIRIDNTYLLFSRALITALLLHCCTAFCFHIVYRCRRVYVPPTGCHSFVIPLRRTGSLALSTLSSFAHLLLSMPDHLLNRRARTPNAYFTTQISYIILN